MIKRTIENLSEMIEKSNNIVFFGGAGVSTASGIPDFRGTNGLYIRETTDLSSRILKRNFLKTDPKEFYNYFKENFIYPNAKPNFTHRFLAYLEQQNKLSCIITQNIDGLHQEAGSKKVIELHGNVNNFSCTNCHKKYGLQHILEGRIPVCYCGSIIQPDIVLFGDAVDEAVFEQAENAVINCDMLIIAGTTLTVKPANKIVENYKGNKLVCINKDHIENMYYLSNALYIPEYIEEVFSSVAEMQRITL